MNGFARFWGDLLPLRWYHRRSCSTRPSAVCPLGFGAAVRRAGRLAGRSERACLAAAAVRRPESRPMRRAARGARRLRAACTRGVGAPSRSRSCALARHRFGCIRADRPRALDLWCPLSAALSRPALRSFPIAVVDQDHTELSRDFIQDLNADEQLAVTAVAPNTLVGPPAALALAGRRLRIVDIPEGHERAGAEGRTGSHRRLRRRRPISCSTAAFSRHFRRLRRERSRSPRAARAPTAASRTPR